VLWCGVSFIVLSAALPLKVFGAFYSFLGQAWAEGKAELQRAAC